MIVALAERDYSLNLTEIRNSLKQKGVVISNSTVRRRLLESGGKWALPIQKLLFSTKHRKTRLSWTRNMKDMDWNWIIFTDESTIKLNQNTRRLWQFPLKRKVTRSVKHPLKVHVWGCFSAQGFGSIIFFTQNLNGKYMCIIYRKGLLPSAAQLFTDSDNWILQEDNDPKHRSKMTTKWKQDNNVRKLPWPSMSPHLNPIENVWDILKIKIGRKKIRTFKGLKSEIKKEWNRLTPELARKLVDSVRNRLYDVIKAEGDYILY